MARHAATPETRLTPCEVFHLVVVHGLPCQVASGLSEHIQPQPERLNGNHSHLVSLLAGRPRIRNSTQHKTMKETIGLILDCIGWLLGMAFFLALLWL
jgi:hypothetical protein